MFETKILLPLETKLLMHPPPGEGECIQSYLGRLIPANNLPNLLGRPMFDLIRGQVENGKDFRYLLKLTGLKAKFIRRIKWRDQSSDDCVFDELYSAGVPNPWRSSYFAFCPLCVKAEFYYKSDWGTRLNFMCLKHSCLLVDLCRTCWFKNKRPFYKNWTELFSDSFNCRNHMRNKKPLILRDPIAIGMQKAILRMLDGRPHIAISRNLSITNEEFSLSLKLLYALIYRAGPDEAVMGNSKFVRELLKFGYPQRDQFPVDPYKWASNVEKSFTRINYIFYRSCYHILCHWPNSFYALMDILNNTIRELNAGYRPVENWELTDTIYEALTAAAPSFIHRAFKTWLNAKLNVMNKSSRKKVLQRIGDKLFLEDRRIFK